MHYDDAAPCTIGRCQRSTELGRWCCSTCTEQMRAWLRDIEQYANTLDATPGVGGDGGRRSPGYGSRPPANLDVIAAMDRRSVGHVIGADDTENATRSIIGTLRRLVEWVRDERRRLDEPPEAARSGAPTIATETRYLLGRIDWCTRQAWIDDLADDIRELHAQVRRLAGEAPPRSLAPCGGCGGPLFPVGDAYTVAVRCGDCGGTYDGVTLLDLGQRLAFEMMGTAS